MDLTNNLSAERRPLKADNHQPTKKIPYPANQPSSGFFSIIFN
jgi:hypothetical protein